MAEGRRRSQRPSRRPKRENRAAVATLVYALEAAYRGDPAQSLVANLRDVREEEWQAVPPGGARSIADIAEHVGWAKHMYHDCAFGDGTLEGETLAPPARDHASMLAWLDEGHTAFAQAVLDLASDAELLVRRPTPEREPMETRAIVWTLIAHDTYHAGEINRTRALLRGEDRWPYDVA